ncbi:MAG: ABC transporter permease subunit, partial [Pseudomonadota bacterium]
MVDTAADQASVALPAKRQGGLGLSSKTIERIMPWAVVISLFLVWELAVRIFDFPQFILPAPSVIFESMWQWRVPIIDNAAQTAMTTVVGFGIAIVFGLVTGILVGSSSLIYNGFYPVLIGFNSIPKVAVVPILVIWFGIGTVPAIITAFLISFFPILVNVATGIATVEQELKDVLRALGASNR